MLDYKQTKLIKQDYGTHSLMNNAQKQKQQQDIYYLIFRETQKLPFLVQRKCQ